MISWVIFDIGGILVQENTDFISSQIADKLGIETSVLIQVIGKYYDQAVRGRKTLFQVYRSAIQVLGLPFDPKDILELHLKLYRNSSTQHDTEIVSLLKRLKKRYSTACLTNTEPEIVDICSETGLFDYFDRRYLSTEMGMKKPDAEIYKTVLSDISCQPNEVLFIDDRKENIAGGKSVGMEVILYFNSAQLIRDLPRFCPSLFPGDE